MIPGLSGLLSLLHRVELDERPRSETAVELDPIDPNDVVTGAAIGVRNVGAWTGASSMASPKAAREAVAFAQSLGMKRLDVIVNDHSAWRAPSKFTIYDPDKIAGLALRAREAGMAVHLMSWVMPHRDYLLGARDALLPLLERTGARSIQFDAEEPWTLAKSPMPYVEAAALLRSLFPRAQTMDDSLNVIVGVNAIGYTPAEKVGPLLAVADYVVPQCYATSSSKLDPGTVVARLVQRWRKTFQFKPACTWVAGLAAYRQTGIPGYTAEAAMRAAFAGAEAQPGVREVVYWSLAQIKASATATRTIKALAGRTVGG